MRSISYFALVLFAIVALGTYSVSAMAAQPEHGKAIAVATAEGGTHEAAAAEGHGGMHESGSEEMHKDVQEELGKLLPWWSVIPFILILLAIALIPLIHEEWWESNLNKGVISFLLSLPVFAYLLSFGHLGQEVIVEVMHEYYAFIILLVALFTISGGIYLEGDLKATPLVNTLFLGIGALMASFIGTTGAAMLLIRPLIKTNKERKKKVHIFIFFIFLVANIGGSLLPIGDPPLFLGYLFGVPFFWTMIHLWPMWVTEVGILLVIFYIWDTFAYSKEDKKDLKRDARATRGLKIHGKVNIVLLLGVLASVVFLTKHETIDLSWMQQPVMILLALISYAIDHKAQEKAHKKGHHQFRTPRHKNEFTFHAMIEVAVLFIGIFITMAPAICMLKAFGSQFGITHPWQFYWMTGGLSSFLDNAPTYATFFALGQGVTKGLIAQGADITLITTKTAPIALHILIAISIGAVFMGANTYIGNAPNFMVKSICEESKIKMPSFFGYMLYSVGILVPTFLLIMVMYLM